MASNRSRTPHITLTALAALGLLTACQVRGQAGMGVAAPIGPVPDMSPTPVATGGAAVSVEVHVSFFGVPLDGADDVVFVLDRSGSMGLVSAGVSGQTLGMSKTKSALASLGGSLVNSAAGGPLPSKLEAAQDELIRTLYAMPDGTRVGVIFFDDEINALAPRMWTLTPGTRERAAAFIRGIKPGGSTAAVPAMRLAYRMGAQRIVLLSDGLANNGGSGGDLLAEARPRIYRGLRIDTVGLGLDQDAALMQTLARESGGLAVMR